MEKLAGKNVQKTRRVGGREVRQWRTSTRKVGNLIGHVTSAPRTLAPRLPDVCEKNVFPFFRASASGKQHISTSPQANNDVSVKKKMTNQRNKVKVHHKLIMKMAFLFVRNAIILPIPNNFQFRNHLSFPNIFFLLP